MTQLDRTMMQVAVAVLTCATGCAGWKDYTQHLVHKHQAHKAWQSTLASAYSGPCPWDYKEGWKAGYYDVARGENGCVPAVPPQKYWDCKYQRPEGQLCVCTWFEGYRDGVEAARAMGAWYCRTIPASPTAVLPDRMACMTSPTYYSTWGEEGNVQPLPPVIEQGLVPEAGLEELDAPTPEAPESSEGLPYESDAVELPPVDDEVSAGSKEDSTSRRAPAPLAPPQLAPAVVAGSSRADRRTGAPEVPANSPIALREVADAPVAPPVALPPVDEAPFAAMPSEVTPEEAAETVVGTTDTLPTQQAPQPWATPEQSLGQISGPFAFLEGVSSVNEVPVPLPSIDHADATAVVSAVQPVVPTDGVESRAVVGGLVEVAAPGNPAAMCVSTDASVGNSVPLPLHVRQRLSAEPAEQLIVETGPTATSDVMSGNIRVVSVTEWAHPQPISLPPLTDEENVESCIAVIDGDQALTPLPDVQNDIQLSVVGENLAAPADVRPMQIPEVDRKRRPVKVAETPSELRIR